jgi:hypothetical protein
MILCRPRLFHFLHGKIDNDPDKHPDEAELVTVTVGGDAAGENNDLMSCLSAQLSAPLDLPERQEYIFEPSDVVAFELVSNSSGTSSQSTSFGGISERKAFRYPKHIYLDRFLQVNSELSNAKRAEQREMSAELDKLFIRRKSLTSFNVCICSTFNFIVGALLWLICNGLLEQGHAEGPSGIAVLL